MTRLQRITVDTVADLQAVDGIHAGEGDIVTTRGYYTAGDGGGNTYIYHTTGYNDDEDGGFIIAGGSTAQNAADWFEAADQSVVNVKQFGARGDDDATSNDSTAAIQNAVWALARNGNADAAGYRGGKLFFPGGFYRITSTINFEGKSGSSNNIRSFVIEGTGRVAGALGGHPAPTAPNSGSCVFWDGGSGAGEMFRLSASGFAIRDIALWGEPPGGDGSARCDNGMIVTNVDGIATGNCELNNLGIENVDVAIQMGELITDGNCENVCADYLTFSFCRVGYRVMNPQAVGHSLQFVNAYYVETVFEFQSGGKFLCHYLSMIKSEQVINFVSNGGGFISPFRFDVVLIDGAMPATPQLVGTESAGSTAYIRVTFGDVTWPNSNGCRPDGRPLVQLAGGWDVKVDAMSRWPLDRRTSTTVTYAAGTWTGWPGDVSGTDMWLRDGSLAKVSSTGSLPGTFQEDTWYYLVNVVNDEATPQNSTFQLAATRDGTPITGTGESGTLTLLTKSTLADLQAPNVLYQPICDFDSIKFLEQTAPADFWETSVSDSIVYEERYASWFIRRPMAAGNTYKKFWGSRENYRFRNRTAQDLDLNVRNFGAIGDNATDDTAAFQLAIAEMIWLGNNTGFASRNQVGRLHVPSGNYRLSSSLDFRQLGGCVIEGDGASPDQLLGGANRARTATNLIWTAGSGGGPMVVLLGSNVCVKNMSFWGAPEGTTTNYADQGVLIRNDAIGTQFDNVSFIRLGSGIVTGDASGSASALDTSLENVAFVNCDIGFESLATGTYGVNAGSLIARETGTAFWMWGGGGVNIQSVLCQTSVGTILRFARNAGDPSSMTLSSKIGFVTIPATQSVTPRIVWQDSTTLNGSLGSAGFVKIGTVAAQSQANGTIRTDGIPLFSLNSSMNVIVEELTWFNANAGSDHVSTFSGSTWTSNDHGLLENAIVTLSTDGVLPTGFSPGLYHVVNPTQNTFELSDVEDGTGISGTGGSGVHTVNVKAALMALRTNIGTFRGRVVIERMHAGYGGQTDPTDWNDGTMAGHVKADANSYWQVNYPYSNTNNYPLTSVGNIGFPA